MVIIDQDMAKTIRITKKRLKGNWVPRLIGRRVSNRATRFQQPNMQKITLDGVTYVASATDLKTVKKLHADGMSHDQIAARFA